MRQPTHLHITWQDENTLKVEADFGTQTRLFHFEAQAKQEPTLQGPSIASWITMGGGGGQANFEKGGALKVVTTQLKAGILLEEWNALHRECGAEGKFLSAQLAGW